MISEIVFKNFRDIAMIPNKYEDETKLKIKEGVLFRTANLCSYKESIVLDLIKNHNVKYVLDLRTEEEMNLFNIKYSEKFINDFVINIPILPNKFPEIKDSYTFFTKYYYSILKEDTEQIKNIFENYFANADRNSIIIHCMSGKDRTGVIIALLLELLGIDRKIITEDYLYSEMQTHIDFITILYNALDKEYGGINNYLINYCGINENILRKVKSNFIY